MNLSVKGDRVRKFTLMPGAGRCELRVVSFITITNREEDP